jgi:type I restriction enzyme S subunit
MSFPRYPKYKDSGVEWLGEVPEHWEMLPLKWATRCCSGDGLSSEEVESIQDPTHSVHVIGGNGLMGYTARGNVEHSALAVGRVGALCGNVHVINPPAWVTDNALILDADSDIFDLRFLSSALRSRNLNEIASKTAQPLITGTQVSDQRIPAPPLPEQTRIVEFLDRETGKIDELVAEQQRLMELLKEKRQAVISHAVTKGLNPRAPMKPSGIEWLGDVPAHWEIRRIKSASTFVTSGPRGWSERVGEEGALFIQSGDLDDSLHIEFAAAKRVQVEDDAEATRTRLRSGDVVVCITGAKTGNVAVCDAIPEAAYVNQHLCLVRPDQEILPMFLGILLKSRIGQTYFELSQYGLKQGLSLEDVKEAPVLLPPPAEQAAIVDHLCNETAKLDALAAEAQKAIDLLQERRTALISAAVTGQIDVRKLATA